MNINFRSTIRALGLALLSTAPTALLFGFLTRSHNDLFYLMMVIHCLGFIGAVVAFLLPEEKQWKFIRGLAALGVAANKNPKPKDYEEIFGEIEKLERKSMDEEAARIREEARREDWGARKSGEDRHGDGERRRHGDTGKG